MNSDLDSIAAVARKASLAAGELVQKFFGHTLETTEKAYHDLVTEADVESERLITAMIREVYPHHHFLGEENEHEGQVHAEDLWIIDPIDGTNNFAHQIPHFGISVGYARRGEMMVGFVLDPMRKELFSAIEGRGAMLNDRPIVASPNDDMDRAMIATGFDRAAVREPTLEVIEALYAAGAMGVRRYGAAALDICWTACGRFDCFFEFKLKPWDYAAGMLIAAESGCACLDLHGEPLRLGAADVFIANPRLQERLISVIRGSLTEGESEEEEPL
jgi:myo-inositol-1(or 4)-monophosphatase